MANVKLVKSIYTLTDVTALGEVEPADNAALPGSLSVESLTASKPVVTDGDKKLVSKDLVSDDVYGPSWNGVTDVAPSKNAVYNKIEQLLINENLIGIPGELGFGVGVCPPDIVPDGLAPLPGYLNPASPNYGNYRFKDGSVMVYVPQFYYRIGSALNDTYPTYGVNSVQIKGYDTFQSADAANVSGYALHRAFYDGGMEQKGFFIDKYKCSKIANGSGYTAGSVKNGAPLSSAAAHNPFDDLTGGANACYSAVDLAHRRDGVDGAVNPDSIFHCKSVFQNAALALLSLAHGQYSQNTTNCAWYHATDNFPKGCNDGALKDYNDVTVTYAPDGYSNSGKTGSGMPFAKTTHNGQSSGVCDLNGGMWEIMIGATAIITSSAIEAWSQDASSVITVTSHGLVTGDYAQITGVTQASWVGANNKMWQITRLTDHTFSIGFNSSSFAAYDAVTDAGVIAKGKFYATNASVAMKSYMSGASTAVDHWGAAGVAATMTELAPPFKSGYDFGMRYGSGANQVLDESLTGDGWLLTGMGLPKNGNAVDVTGTNLFGQDYFYQYMINALCLLSSGSWNFTSSAGVWGVYWRNTRADSNAVVGFRLACYPE